METFTVSFFGHRQIENVFAVERKLEKIICDLLNRKEYVEFLVGRDGEFDLLAASIIKRCKQSVRDDNSALVWVLPYSTAEFRNNEEAYLDYYDEIEIYDEACHYKKAHQMRNRAMVDRSDLVVFCVEHKSGGAYQTMKYANRQGTNYINILEEEIPKTSSRDCGLFSSRCV